MSIKAGKIQIGITETAVCAFLAACSILTGKLLAINLTSFIRLSFENLPILLAAFYFGPLAGAAVGIVADLTGCIMVGYAINPIITLGAALVGLCAGIAARLPVKNKVLNCLFTVVSAHIVGSVTVKTIGLIIFYHSPVLATFGWRLLTYTLISAAETALLYILTNHRTFDREMRKFTIAGKGRED